MENPRHPDEDPTIDPILKLIETMGVSAVGEPSTQPGAAAAAETGGTPARTNEMIALQCLTEASRLTDEIIERLSRRLAGEEIGDNPHERDDTAALAVVVDAAKRAAASDDPAAYDAYFSIFDKADNLPYLPVFGEPPKKKHIVSLCLEGINKLGSQRAADALHRALQEEAEQAAQIEALKNANRVSGSDYPHHDTELLVEVVDYCQLNGIPADHWINMYARSDEHARQLRRHAIVKALKEGVGDSQTLLDQLDALCTEVLTHDADSLNRNAFYALQNTRQPAVRAALFNRFLGTVKELPPPTIRSLAGDSILGELIDVGLTSLRDPQLADSKVAAQLDEAIEKRVKEIMSIGGYLLHIGLPYVRWKIAYEGGPEANAQTVLGIIDSATNRLMGMQPANPYDKGMPEGSTDNSQRALYIKDMLTLTHGRRALAQGDFKQAGEFARGARISISIFTEATTQATTRQQLEDLGLEKDSLEIMLEPRLGTLLQFAEAKFTDNPQALVDAVLEYVRACTIKYGDLEKSIVDAYRHIAARDSVLGQSFARDLLAALRANATLPGLSSAYSTREELSHALIRAGDQEEIQRTRQEIGAMESPAERRQALYNLARLLAEASQK